MDKETYDRGMAMRRKVHGDAVAPGRGNPPRIAGPAPLDDGATKAAARCWREWFCTRWPKPERSCDSTGIIPAPAPMS